MATPAETLLKLTIKGVDPAEAARIVASSTQALEAELRASMDRQASLYRTAAESANAQSRAYAQAELKQQQSKAQAILDVIKAAQREEDSTSKAHSQAIIENEKRTAAAIREARIASNAEKSYWRRSLEDAENATIVVQGFFSAVSGGLSRLHAFGEEVVRTTQIFQSEHVSIEAAAEAVDHTASSMELIVAANRAAESGLDITAKQFADIAVQAKKFADATGIDSAAAIEKLTAGIADGTPKVLKHLGLIIDTDKAYAAFAKTLGVAANGLDDEQKRTAIQTAALEELSKRSTQAAADLGKPLDVAHALEQAFAHSKDTWDKLVASIGSFQLPEWMKSSATADQGTEEIADWDQTPAAMARRENNVKILAARKKRDDAAAAAFRARMDAGGEDLASQGGDISGDEYQQGDPYRAAQMAEARRKSIFSKAGKNASPYDALSDYGKAQAARDEAEKIKNDNELQFATQMVGMPHEGAAQAMLDAHDQQFAGGTYTGKEQDDFATAQGKAMESAKKAQAGIDDLTEKSGGTLMARLLFGPDGPQSSYDKLDEFMKHVVDASGEMSDMVSHAGGALAAGYGKGIAAAIADGKNLKNALRDTTHDVLENLASQSIGRALWELAEAAADEAAFLSNPLLVNKQVAVGAHLAAAAAFGAVGVGAALGARAVGHSSSGASAGSTPTASGGAFTSGPQSSGITDNSTGPVSLNIYVAPGGEAEAGHSIVAALTAWSAQTGKDLSHLVGKN